MRQSEQSRGRKVERRQGQVRRQAVELGSRSVDPGLVPSHRGDSGRSSLLTEVAQGRDEAFLTVRDIEVRYGIGRTRAYQLVKEPWFPEPVVEGSYRWSLTSLEVAEAAKAAGDRSREGVVAPKPKRQRRR